MTTVKTPLELHREAMALADEADTARRAGKEAAALKFLTLALAAESTAAGQTMEEPSRSVLLRSAASLALELRQLREAERLVARALSADPPPVIADELRDILEQVYFSRHLDLRGMILAPDELQMSLAGEAVGFGLARTERFLKRLDDVQKLIYRTAERKIGSKFREESGPAKAVRSELEVYVSAPRPASFAVTFRLARPHMQELAFPELQPAQVLSEILSCLDLVNRGEDQALRGRISEEKYLRNFRALAKQIAPDGREINLVGFTTPHAEGERRLEFTRPSRQIAVDAFRPDEDGSKVELRGRILFADGQRQRSKIKIVSKDRSHTVRVPAGMMTDIVRPLWDVDVVVVCSRRKGGLVLEDVQRVSD